MKIEDIKKRSWNTLTQQEKELYCALDGSYVSFLDSVAAKQNVNIYYTPDLTPEEVAVVDEYFRACSLNDME